LIIGSGYKLDAAYLMTIAEMAFKGQLAYDAKASFSCNSALLLEILFLGLFL